LVGGEQESSKAASGRKQKFIGASVTQQEAVNLAMMVGGRGNFYNVASVSESHSLIDAPNKSPA
jgi:hypothetical protein